VLLGKTAVGALAYGDIWQGGRSRNPWNPDEGSSGSSAGSASATAAGLAGFGIGTETLGSIISPSHRCGLAGLRPTYGRVSRHGGMSLCWSWDKVGALARSVVDCGLVLSVINGGDSRDWGSIDAPFGFDWQARIKDLRVGYVPAFFDGVGATDIDRRALAAVRELGVTLVEVSFPDLPLASLNQLVTIEAAAAFSELTLSNRDDMLKWQDDSAWPNSWRRARLYPAVDMVQLERLRRRTMVAFDGIFSQVDALIGPNYAGGALVATNATGHPSLAVKAGFIEAPTRGLRDEPIDPAGPKYRVPRTVSLWAPLFREDVLIALGRALEEKLGVAEEHPKLARE
jgi:Asp-tRNA(Asn)/Glu-tRNA(Gln) amidotransferase A subunit family amidase